ncbi:hypothetical protein FOXB_13994 [Fusarium oxysporum f. sp. conglutinans Fo5176]|uniref:Uncharacterized protein n=1 Tax=Fusarium oxysporum (strain Fo5176) TaxID=660025 RepID=F9G5R2_FUSOF|nr:hypothetical protein FOXB_13994 [Fusarium oxysporum f. sp. conglutinans Fo5176]
MNWRPLPWWSRMHFREYRCIVCNSVLRVHPSQNSVTEYVPTDRCYNCNYEISYSLATHDETSSQQFLQTRLPLVQAAEQIADELAEASTSLGGKRRRWELQQRYRLLTPFLLAEMPIQLTIRLKEMSLKEVRLKEMPTQLIMRLTEIPIKPMMRLHHTRAPTSQKRGSIL